MFENEILGIVRAGLIGFGIDFGESLYQNGLNQNSLKSAVKSEGRGAIETVSIYIINRVFMGFIKL